MYGVQMSMGLGGIQYGGTDVLLRVLASTCSFLFEKSCYGFLILTKIFTGDILLLATCTSAGHNLNIFEFIVFERGFF